MLGTIPHKFCLGGNDELLWQLVIYNAGLFVAYMSISIRTLVRIFDSRNTGNAAIQGLYFAFIFGCGLTHVMHMLTIFWPVYRMEAVIGLAAFAVSAVTAVAVWMPWVDSRLRGYDDLRRRDD